jgi:hypothetical protein
MTQGMRLVLAVVISGGASAGTVYGPTNATWVGPSSHAPSWPLTVGLAFDGATAGGRSHPDLGSDRHSLGPYRMAR